MSSAGPPIHLDNSLGAAFIGLILAAVLCGITNAQTLWFFQGSRQDPLFLKWMVGFLWILDMLHLALICHACYTDLVTNFTNLAIIEKLSWSLCLHIYVTTLSDFIVRLFYTRRVWIMSKQSWFLTLGSFILALITFISGFGFASKSFSYSSILQFKLISWVLYISLGSAVLADLWVAITLCWFLGRNRTGFKSTDTKINVLMLYIINTGLLTALCSIGCFVSFAAMPNNFVFIGFYFCLSKLYLNSLLATLNARDKIRGFMSNTGNSRDIGYQLPQIIGTNGSGSKYISTTISTNPGSPARGSFGFVEKEQSLAISVQTNTVTDYQAEMRKPPEFSGM